MVRQNPEIALRIWEALGRYVLSVTKGKKVQGGHQRIHCTGELCHSGWSLEPGDIIKYFKYPHLQQTEHPGQVMKLSTRDI